MTKKFLSLILCMAMVIMLLPVGTVTVSAASNIKIRGVDIGYAVGDYFSKNGKACSCHNKGLCVPETSKCNCIHVAGCAQCYGFALWCENKMFGYNDVSSGKKFESFGYVAAGKLTSDKLKELIAKAPIGSHIRTNGSQHSMILYSKSSTGFSVVQANGSNNDTLGYSPCRIGIATYTWSNYFTKGSNPYGKRGIAFIKYPTGVKPDPDPTSLPSLKEDSSYKTPISCVAYKKMNVYYSSGSQDTGHYISAGDACTIDAVYTNGLCSVTYPVSGGKRDAYAKINDFIPNKVTFSSYKADKAYTTYTHSDKKIKYGSLSVGDSCTVVGSTGSMRQLIYPISKGYKLGWIDTNDLKDIVKPTAEPNPVSSVTAPLPVAKGFFKGKKVVFAAPQKIEISSDHWISKGDICTIEKMITDDNGEFTGNCKVKYPTEGHNDVFESGCPTSTVTIAISKILTKYSDNYEVYEVPKAVKKYTVYPANKKDTMGHTWYVSKDDQFFTIATANDADGNKMTEVLYPCTEGAHKGYYKLGWIYLDYYHLNLNGFLDDTENATISGYGYADITVNGEKTVKAQDFWKLVPEGSAYTVNNIKALSRHTYNGVYSGTASGVVKSSTSVDGQTKVVLNFSTNPPVLQDIYISSNPYKTEYLEGEWLDTNGLAVTARYDDASTQNVTGSCGISGYDSSPGVKTINVSFGGYETAFTVNVRSKSPTKIEIASLPAKTVYNIGDEIDLTGLTVKATYDNGTSALVDDYGLSIDEGATSEAGQVYIGVFYIYNDIAQYTSFNIEVKEAPATPEPATEVPQTPEPVTEAPQTEAPSDAVIPTIEKTDGKVGDTITATVSLPSGVEAAGGSFNLVYDPEVMELVDVTVGSLITDRANNVNKAYAADKIRVNFAGTSPIAQTGGVMLTATFRLKVDGSAILNTEAFKLLDENANALVTQDAEAVVVVSGDNPTEEPTETPTEGPNGARVKLADVVAELGEGTVDVEVPITLSGVDNAAGLQLALTYDDALQLKSVEKGEALPSLTFTTGTLTQNPIVLLWDGERGDADPNGVVAVLTFSVPVDSEEIYEISAEIQALYDDNMDDINASVLAGSIEVKEQTMAGDMDENKILNAKDVTLLRRAIAANSISNQKAADVSGDGLVNAKDVTLLRRMIAQGKSA